MKKFFYLFLLLGLAVVSCNKSEVLPTEVEVSFQASMGGTNFKSGDGTPVFDCDAVDADHATLTISVNGTQTDFDVKILTNVDGTHTESIKLAPSTSYSLESFILYDSDNNPILATPVVNSNFSNFVTKPLPIAFTTEKFAKNSVTLQVLCYTPTTITDFGFTWFTFEKVTVRELCLFGDICAYDPQTYEGSLYATQANGVQTDMPAIFRVQVSMKEGNDWVLVAEEDNEEWKGEGAALCIQYPDYVGVDEYKIELLVYNIDEAATSGFSYQTVKTWEFTDNSFPDLDGANGGGTDGVIDFVIGDCVPGADIIFPPTNPPTDPPSDPSITEETAFARGDDTKAICFSTFFANARWGWTNGPYANGTYTLDLFAGAAQCDTEKGTDVGDLTLTYNSEGHVSVTYTASAGFEFDQLHLYVGNLEYQLTNTTFAPGNFPDKVENLTGNDRKVYTFDLFDLHGVSFTGDIYIIAHADVYGNFPTNK